MLRNIIRNVSSGYATKAVQFLVSIMLLPFLISKDNLGLSGWGVVSTLLAITAFFSILMDGWRLSIARAIGTYVSGRDKNNITTSILLSTLVMTLSIVLIAVVCLDELLRFSKLDSLDSIEMIFFVLLTQFAVEQICYPAEVYLHAAESTWLVNACFALEVVLRAISILYVFTMGHVSIVNYFLVLCVFVTLRCGTIFLIAIYRVPSFSFGRIIYQKETLNESLPLSIKGLGSYLAFRGSVVLANRYLGVEAAGIVGLALINLRGYLQQTLVSIIRPMIIPLASGVDINAESDARRTKIFSLVDTYQLLTMLFCLSLGITAPILIPLWLGADLGEYAIILGLFLAFLGLEVGASVRSFIIISQGHGRLLAFPAIVLSLIHIAALIILGSRGQLTHVIVLLSTSIYIFLNLAVIVPLIYDLKLSIIRRKSRFGFAIMSCVAILPTVSFLTLSNDVTSFTEVAVVLFLSVLLLVGAHHLFVNSISSSVSSLKLVLSSFNR